MLRGMWRRLSILWTVAVSVLFLVLTSGKPADQDVANVFFLLALIPWGLTYAGRWLFWGFPARPPRHHPAQYRVELLTAEEQAIAAARPITSPRPSRRS